MTESSKEIGVGAALVERFETQRLPRAQAIKKKVDSGQVLGREDIAFLHQVFEDAKHIKPLADKRPDWQTLVAGAIHLYKEIMDKALANEKSANPGST